MTRILAGILRNWGSQFQVGTKIFLYFTSSTSALGVIILLQNGTRGSFHGSKVAEV
jgi:hypothetical protein